MTGTDRAELAWTASQTVAQAASLWDVEPGYLNTSSYGPPPRPAWEALQQSLDDWRAGRTSWEPWADAVGVARHWFAALVGVDPATVATGAAVSQLLAPVAAAVPDGTRVLVPDVEFTSNVFPWAVHADRGVTVRTAPVDRLADAIARDVDVVAFSAVQSATGEVADVAAISQAARDVGALSVMDTSQAIGWLPVDPNAADLQVCAAYKWLCSPRGTAFLVHHPALAERHPASSPPGSGRSRPAGSPARYRTSRTTGRLCGSPGTRAGSTYLRRGIAGSARRLRCRCWRRPVPARSASTMSRWPTAFSPRWISRRRTRPS